MNGPNPLKLLSAFSNVEGNTMRLSIPQFVGILLPLTLCLLQPLAAQEQSRTIGLGQSVDDSLPAGGSKSYSLALSTGRFVYGEVNQLSVDVVVKAFDPSGKKLLEVDGPARGPEAFHFTTDTAGTFRVEVTPYAASGRFTIRFIADEPKAASPEAIIDQLMARYARSDGPGGVVAVRRDGKQVFVKGYGLANIEYAAPNTPSTPFHLASVSKQFTAFAIVLLEQQGKLSIDDDVRKYVPELHDFGATITLRHLLTHTSGLRDQWELWKTSGHRMDDVIRQQDLLMLMFNQRELNFRPGEEFLYCNSGYMLLSEIVTRVSGMPFAEFLKKHVFEPLGMASTQVYDDHQRIMQGRAYSYTSVGDDCKKAILSYGNSGATSLFSSANDLMKWLQNWKTGQVGGPAALRVMQTVGVLNNGKALDYAIGVRVDQWRGLRRIAHSGSDAGYRTYVLYFPELDSGVIALGNQAAFNSAAIATEAAGAFFSDKLQPEPAPPESAETNKEEPWKPTPERLAAFAGRYYSPELETFYTVQFIDGRLMLLHRLLGRVDLTPAAKENRFYCSEPVPEDSQFNLRTVDFAMPQEGRCVEMRVSTERMRNVWFEHVASETAR